MTAVDYLPCDADQSDSVISTELKSPSLWCNCSPNSMPNVNVVSITKLE
jgi:hypothetical protein